MRLRDRTADGEAEPHAGRLARDERLEYPLAVRRGNAGPVVGDDDAHVLRIVALRAQRDHALAGRAVERLGGIVDEVAQHELDLQPVDEHIGQALLAFDRENVGFCLLAYALEELGKRDALEARAALAEEVAQPPHHFGARCASACMRSITAARSAGGLPRSASGPSARSW